MDSTFPSVGTRYWAVRRLTAPLHRGWLDVSRVGVRNVPETGGAILAANHLSFLDSPVLMYALSRQVTMLGKVEYLSRPLTRRLFPAAGMIPVDRTGRGIGRSLAEAERRLRAGEIIGIFPEGTRSRDGWLHGGHAGVAHLALKTGVPIIPVGITGTDEAMPVGTRVPRRDVAITIRFGAPVDLGPWAGTRRVGRVKQEITDHVMAAIGALSGQPAMALTAETMARSDAETIDSCSPTPHTKSRAPVSTAT